MIHRPVAGVVLAFLGAPAWGLSVDTFEDLGPDGEVVTEQTIEGVAITFSTGNGVPIEARTYFDNTPVAFGGPSGLNNDPLNPANVSLTRFLVHRILGVVPLRVELR